MKTSSVVTTAPGNWFGQAMDVTDGIDYQTLQEAFLDNYQNSVAKLKAKGWTPIGNPIIKKHSMRSYGSIDPLNQRSTLTWKQKFEYKGEFVTWLEKFKQERTNEQTTR